MSISIGVNRGGVSARRIYLAEALSYSCEKLGSIEKKIRFFLSRNFSDTSLSSNPDLLTDRSQ
jgi:hypothetical protein